MSEKLNEMIRAEIDRRGLSESAASQRAGLSRVTLNYILKNPEHNPEPDTCHKLAAFFGWDEDYILELAGHRTPRAIREAPKPYTVRLRELEAEAPIPVPIVEQIVHAGEGGGIPMDYTYMPPRQPHADHLKAIYVHGDCMTPTINDGDLVVVDTEEDVYPNDLVIVRTNGEHKVKRFMGRTDSRVVLQCDNPSYPPEEVEDVAIVGVVIHSGKGRASLRKTPRQGG